MYTFTEPPGLDDGGILKSPSTIIYKSYDSGRYIYRSGVYFSHPSFAGCHGNNVTWDERSVNWIQIEALYDLMATTDEVGCTADFYYNNSATYIYIRTENKSPVCFMTSLPDCDTTPLTQCDVMPSDMSRLRMKYIHMQRSKTIVFGDIKVKALLVEDTCDEIDLDDEGYMSVNGVKKAQIEYFKATDGTNDNYTYYPDPSSGQLRHYTVKTELSYVVDVWLTGYKMCEMTGSKRPNYDTDINIEC